HPERFRIEVHRPPEWQRMPVAIVSKNPKVMQALLRSIKETSTVHKSVATKRPPTMRFLEPSHIEITQPGGGASTAVRLMLAPNSTLDIGEGDADGVEGGVGFDSETEQNETDIVTDAEGAPALSLRSGARAGFPLTLRPGGTITV